MIFTDFPPFLFIAILFASKKKKEKMKHLNTFLYSEQTHRSRRAHGNLCQGIFIYGWNVLLFIFIFPLRTIFFFTSINTQLFFVLKNILNLHNCHTLFLVHVGECSRDFLDCNNMTLTNNFVCFFATVLSRCWHNRSSTRMEFLNRG